MVEFPFPHWVLKKNEQMVVVWNQVGFGNLPRVHTQGIFLVDVIPYAWSDDMPTFGRVAEGHTQTQLGSLETACFLSFAIHGLAMGFHDIVVSPILLFSCMASEYKAQELYVCYGSTCYLSHSMGALEFSSELPLVSGRP